MASDKGVGETLDRLLKKARLDTLAPKGCGCAERQENLNDLFPYNNQ